MKLYVNGQDINQLVIANAEDPSSLRTVAVGPEGYLKTIDAFLKGAQAHPTDIEELFVVVGPGSPTALRGILSIVNTMKFVYQIPSVAIRKEQSEQDLDTLESLRAKKGDQVEHTIYLEPIYASGPKITASGKDQLGRMVA